MNTQPNTFTWCVRQAPALQPAPWGVLEAAFEELGACETEGKRGATQLQVNSAQRPTQPMRLLPILNSCAANATFNGPFVHLLFQPCAGT